MAISKSDYDKYLKEILTFADETKDVITDSQGNICFNRLNQMMSIQLKEQKGVVCVEYNGQILPYKKFLSQHLAYMDIMARRIIDKDSDIDNMIYVDGTACLSTEEGIAKGEALSLLEKECTRDVFIGSKICFVTANAGHGKTLLLRKYQHDQAKKFLQGKSDFLFIHIDLHGHDLRKLDTVIMYEMAGILRMPGIYTNSIITLMRNGLLILGVDGFDELAVETGGEKAIGSFNNLVRDLDSQGVLVAASRRTFFNTQDYVNRKGYLDDVKDTYFCFDELRLDNWSKTQCTEYMQWALDDMTPETAEREYDKVLSYLNPSENNPLVERPFLFTNIVECAKKEECSIYDYLREGLDSDLGIERIINSFINREVKKWNSNNITDKREYLTFEQHKQFLATIAEDMWISQREYVSLDLLEFNLSVLLEQWDVLPNLHPDILKMSKSHAFLVADSHGDSYRRFDHEEFKNYFLAVSIETKIKEAVDTDKYTPLKRILMAGQLPDAVAMYLSQSTYDYDRINLTKRLVEEMNKEYRTTYLQTNIGTLVPYLLDNVDITTPITLEPKLVFSSLVFENKSLENIIFRNCYFVNISFSHTYLKNIKFENCEFNDLRLHTSDDSTFVNVIYDDHTKFHQVSEYTEENTLLSNEFTPAFVEQILTQKGICRQNLKANEEPQITNTEYRKAVKRFLNKFNSSSSQYEKNLKEDPIYNSRNYDLYVEDIIPLLIKYHIIKEIENNNSRQQATRAWALDSYDLKEVLENECNPSSEIHEFWDEVNRHG